MNVLTCNAEELFSVVSGSNKNWLLLCLSNPSMSEDHIIALLRNPAISQEVVQSIADHMDWLSNYKVQFGIVNCPQSPYTLAIRMLQLLFWNDLLKITSNFRLNPRLRHIAETYLREKIGSLTLGEKKSLSRTAPRGLIGLLRNETERDVFASLLQNPRLVEEDLLVVINSETTPASILEAVASDNKWRFRYPLRLALVRNRKTPLRFALSFLSKLTKQDLQILVHTPKTSELVRRSAARILAGQY